jgi:hypothetical protein
MSQRTFLQTVLAAVIGLLGFVAVVPQASAEAYSAQALAYAVGVQEAHTEAIMEKSGVVGTAVGLDQQGHIAVKVFLMDSAAAADLPTSLNGVPIEAEVTGEIIAFRNPPDEPAAVDPTAVDPAGRFPRPVPIGVSIGHPEITAGTICCRVRDASGKVYVLSNNHVLADSNHASRGDNVLQPGPFDGGVHPRDTIGTLRRFVRIRFCNASCPPNTMDAAIALSSTALLGKATPPDGYGTPDSTIVSPSIGQRVIKYGRTTAQTRGRISAINATVNISYDSSGTARFVNQIIISPGNFSSPGDSGALVVGASGRNARKPVGLLFAGGSTTAVATPIGPVLSRFNVTIDGQ